MAEIKKPQTTAASGPRPVVKKRKIWKNVVLAKAYIQSSFNNTIITITDDRGNAIVSTSAGACGFKGTKKGTPFAASVAAENAAKKAAESGVKQVMVLVSGPGAGRETAIRSLQSGGLMVTSIRDITPLPHNGCRPPKPRRV
jgi:small subunit ribosomal protein S11